MTAARLTPHSHEERLQWRRLAGFGMAMALISSIGQSFFIGLFGSRITPDLSLDPAQWGAIYALATLCSGSLMFWLGAQSDRRPLSLVLAGAMVLLIGGCLLMAWGSSAITLLIALFLLRLGGQGLTGHLSMVAAARVGYRRGRSLALASLGFVLGEAALPLLVTGLLLNFDWRLIWFSLALILTVLGLVLGWFARRRLDALGKGDADDDSESGIPEIHGLAVRIVSGRIDLLKRPRFLAVLPVSLTSPFVATALFLHQASLVEERGWSPLALASAFTLFALTQVATIWLAGWAVDRFGVRTLFRFYLLPLALGCLALASSSSLWALAALFAGLGLTAGVQNVIGSALWVELFGMRRFGLVRGVYVGLMVLTTALSPLLLGQALAAGISLSLMALLVSVHGLITPWLMYRTVFRQHRGGE